MNDSRQPSLGQELLRHRIDLSTVEKDFGRNIQFVGADVKAVSVSAKVRLVAEAWTSRMILRASLPIVRYIDTEEIELTGWVVTRAHRD